VRGRDTYVSGRVFVIPAVLIDSLSPEYGPGNGPGRSRTWGLETEKTSKQITRDGRNGTQAEGQRA